MATGRPELQGAQEPAWARIGTHVLLPRQFYFELVHLLQDAHDNVDEARGLLAAGLRAAASEMLDGLPQRLAEAAETAARHARNSGVY